MNFLFQNNRLSYFKKLLTIFLRFCTVLQKEVCRGKFALQNDLDKPEI